MACIALHILIHYFMVATYMWMLAEGILVAETVIGSHISKRDIANNWFLFVLGLYLYIVLVVTFVSEKRVKQGLYVLGWGVPFLVILAYLIARGAFSSEEEMNM